MRNTFGIFAASAIVFALPNLVSQGRTRTIVAVLAHADDETAAGPVLARYAREGVEVHLIIASDGSAGSGSSGNYLVRPDSLPKGDSLAMLRQAEARCAATALGAREPVFLGFPDGNSATILRIEARCSGSLSVSHRKLSGCIPTS